ncbi:hypothetical protein VTK73DRAFT_9229 [Phialemonium thermophilum]|uniref:Heterokaryon incompatibility domain-containing protein n=1 Tax=Phialemonium thermophilum TaxID=223376 RepID=A0ABR3W3K1_9PEZI
MQTDLPILGVYSYPFPLVRSLCSIFCPFCPDQHALAMAAERTMSSTGEPTTRLCDRCQTLDFNDEELGGFVDCDSSGYPALAFDRDHRERVFPTRWRCKDQFPGLPELKAAAEAGCEFCALLRDAITDGHTRPMLGPEGVDIALEYTWRCRTLEPGPCSLGLVANITFQRDQSSHEISFAVGSDEKPLAEWLRLAELPGSTVIPEDSTRFMREAIGDCCAHDPFCGLDSGFVPTRLLDLGDHPTDTPALVITKQHQQSIPRYAALSYCWGPAGDAAMQLKTDETTLPDRLRGIPLDSMSPVMRDAVEVCRALSVRYLWIDSLCIIQGRDGQTEDWDRESQLMGEIFMNSYVTICAVASDSCQQSFLRQTAWSKVSVPYKSRVKPTIAGTYWLRRTRRQPETDGDPFAGDVFKSPWVNRGWVHQELILSRRLLLFGERMIHFHCSGTSRSENRSAYDGVHFSLLTETVARARSWYWDPARDAPETFTRIRQGRGAYAEKSLTIQTDRLSAYAGVARVQLEIRCPGDEYLAGIWRSELPSALLWLPRIPQQVFDEVVSARQPQVTQIAPSWSWACQNEYFEEAIGPMDVARERHLRPEYERIGSHIIPAGSSEFGRIRSGSLTFQAKMRRTPSALCSLDLGPEYNLVWTTRIESAYVAHCGLDWKTGWRGSGRLEPPMQLWMMLLASSCALYVSPCSFCPIS